MGYEASSSDADRYECAKRRREAAEAMLMLCNKRSHLQPPSDGSREQIEAVPVEVPGVGCQTDTKQTNETQVFEESRSVGCQMDTKQTNESQVFEESRSVRTRERLSSNQDMLKFYTGIPNWIISALLKLVTPALPVMP